MFFFFSNFMVLGFWKFWSFHPCRFDVVQNPISDKGKKQIGKEKDMEGDAKEETLPPGFRFHPTDEELITYYLQNKISDADFSCRAIGDVDLNKCEPWDLPGSFDLRSSC